MSRAQEIYISAAFPRCSDPRAPTSIYALKVPYKYTTNRGDRLRNFRLI